MKTKLINNYVYLVSLVIGILMLQGCSKYDYRTVEEPAYLRVFNCLSYEVKMENKDLPVPFLTMLIDPEFDENGIPIGAAIVGDFLDTRRPYAPPFPFYTGNKEKVNYEYPGNEDVLVGPIMNGINMASWAQIPSGEHRIIFVNRPKTDVPFAQLEERFRKQVSLDTVLTLDAKEVYTLNVLQKDLSAKENFAYLRKESFHKQAFDDQKVYVNFYNLSNEGYWKLPNDIKPMSAGVQDEMSVYVTLRDLGEYAPGAFDIMEIPGYTNRYLGKMYRNTSSNTVTPYFSFPLFAKPNAERITNRQEAEITVLVPYMSPQLLSDSAPNAEFIRLTCNVPTNVLANTNTDPYYRASKYINFLTIRTHAGKNKEQVFSTISSIEFVNGSVYLTSVQRVFPEPEF